MDVARKQQHVIYKNSHQLIFLLVLFSNLRIPTDFRFFIYCVAIREGGDKEWYFAERQYRKENDSLEISNLLIGMSCTKQSWLIDRFLTNLLDKNITKDEDVLSGLFTASLRPDSIFKTWNFVKENWEELYARYSQCYKILCILVQFLFKKVQYKFSRIIR